MYLKFKTNFSVIILLMMLIVSCKSTQKEKSGDKNKKPIVVDWIVAKSSATTENITVSGTIKPAEETVLLAEISGRVTKINFEEGKFVKKGTLLVKLFDDDLQAQLKKATAQLQIAQQTLKRQAELLKVSGISQADYDQTELQINSLNGDIEVIKAQIRKTEILAPYDGRLGLRNISPGTVVSPSLPLTTIRDVGKLKLDFSVPGKYASYIHIGSKVKFTVNTDMTGYDAVVIATEQGIDASTRNMKTRALISQPGSKLAPGAYATVSLSVSDERNAIFVPSQAIIPNEKGKKVIVCRDGKAAFVDVKEGLRQTNGVEIIDGLSENDTVVVTGVMFVKPNDALKLKKKQ